MTTGTGRTFGVLGFFFALLLAAPVHAVIATIEAKAIRTLTTGDGRFGGCMVQLDESLSDSGLNCPSSNWVTFSCTGEHTSKDEGFRMFESAQMAFALDKTIVLEVTDEKKHNGHCYARRVDVKKN